MDHKKFLLIMMSAMAFTLRAVSAHGKKVTPHGRQARAAANVVIDRPVKRVAAQAKTTAKKANNKLRLAHKSPKKKVVLTSRRGPAKKQKKAVLVQKKKPRAASVRRGTKSKLRSMKKRPGRATRMLTTRMHADYPSNDKMVAIAKMFGSDIDLKS